MLDTVDREEIQTHASQSPKGRQVRNPAMTTKGGQGTPKRDVYRGSENIGQNTEPENMSKIQNPHRHWAKTRNSTNACLFGNGRENQ